MVDIIRTVKSIMDAHGAWVFGGAVAASLVAHHAKKRRSFGADWFQVTCYGCGRAGFSDEFEEVTTPQGREAHQCIRCRRPDIFKQAEGVDYSTIVYRVRVRDVDDGGSGENYHYRTVDSAMEHVNNVIAAYDWYGFEEVPVAGERRRWKTTSGEDWEIMMTPIRLGNIVREAEYDYDEYGFITGSSAERLVAKILRDDPYDYEVGDHLLIIDGKIVEVGGNSQMEHFEKEDFWDNVDEHMIVVIKSVDPYTFDWELHQDEPVFHGAEATNACPHCEGAAGFPREFYYQSDRIEMVPCGTCLTQGRCPGCMELYSNLSRDNTPEDVFFGSGCTRCGYSESDAREARKTARRWADLVDNPAAAKFMAEGGRGYKGVLMKPLDRPDRGQNCDADGCDQPVSKRRKTWGWVIGLCDACDRLVDGDRYDAEDSDDEFYVHSADEMYGPYYSLADAEDAVDRLSGKGIDIRGITLGKSGYYLEAEDDLEDYIECKGCSNSLSFAGVMNALGWTFDGYCDQCVGERMDAEGRYRVAVGQGGYSYTPLEEPCPLCGVNEENVLMIYRDDGTVEKACTRGDCDMQMVLSAEELGKEYGVGDVWMADSYDAATHGNLLPMGSVKRFLASMPVSQKFHVDFVKSNGEIRSMDAVLTKPYDPDSRTADVLEITNTGTSFKRFRVDRVFVLYRV